jgi:hypothetical protein
MTKPVTPALRARATTVNVITPFHGLRLRRVVNEIRAPEARVHHIAFELENNAHHAGAADTLRAAGVRLLWGPARHMAGHNLAGYHYRPDKVMVEFYTDMDKFIPELGIQEPRPWHEYFPMKQKRSRPLT